jgi:hypothetical protein
MTAKPAPLANVWSGIVTLGLLACGLFFLLDAFAPPQDLPWKPLDLRQPIGWATADKVARLVVDYRASPQQVEARTTDCLALLRQAGVQVRRGQDRDDGGFCVVRGAVRITGGAVMPLAPADVVMQCPLAVRYVIWDRQVLQPAARDILGSAPARVENYGTYSCRRIYGSQDVSERPSEHARANALDVAGVTLADGRTVTVLDDWRGVITPADRDRYQRRAAACHPHGRGQIGA